MGVGVQSVMVRRCVCGRVVLLPAAVFLLVLATRLPVMPEHLFSFDSVNLALALEEFDPAHHQPHPPGYPLFVAEARLVHSLVGTPERTFAVLKILISSIAVVLIFLLGARMFSTPVGVAAAALLFCNPVFWHSGLTSSLRLHLALVSLLGAYCCWRALCGEDRFSYGAGLAIGLGSGFRPELALFLVPLWIWTLSRYRRPWFLFSNTLLLLAGGAAWFLPLLIAYGGWGQMLNSYHVYLMEQSQSALVLLGDPVVEWRRMVGSTLLWNGLGTFTWVWALAVVWRNRSQFAQWQRQAIFLAVWLLPAFLFHMSVHIGAPGHALVSIPALCLAGGLCIVEAQQVLTAKRPEPSRWFKPVLALALAANVLLFYWPYHQPQRKEVTQFRGWASIKDAVRVGTYEASYAQVRSIEETTRLALRQIDALKAGSQNVVVMWNRDAVPVWRKVSYYYPSERVYELVGRRTSRPRARLWRGNRILSDASFSPEAKVSVPVGGRLIWLVHPDVVPELARSVSLRGVFPAYYTDLPKDSPPFRWGSFEFVPE